MRSLLSILLLLTVHTNAYVFSAPRRFCACTPLVLAQPRSQVQLSEFSTKVKVTVEANAPLRQARIFFFYPATIAGASVASYVALTRLIAGLGGFRTDLTPLNDAGNLLIDVAVVAAAVYFLRGDLKSREQELVRVRDELEGPPTMNSAEGKDELLDTSS
mmetsp:Transcript_47240/g.100831  ORF Transcript_47240/g.100831 Transcript_47240/m.100831 type:complete len:160 (-) Transcript_47240:218-697(-)